MNDQVIRVIAYAQESDIDSDIDQEPVLVEDKQTISGGDVRFHPTINASSTDGASGISMPELLEEFEAEFNVVIEMSSDDDEHQFDIVDHSFDSATEVEECVENLCSSVCDWVVGK